MSLSYVICVTLISLLSNSQVHRWRQVRPQSKPPPASALVIGCWVFFSSGLFFLKTLPNQLLPHPPIPLTLSLSMIPSAKSSEVMEWGVGRRGWPEEKWWGLGKLETSGEASCLQNRVSALQFLKLSVHVWSMFVYMCGSMLECLHSSFLQQVFLALDKTKQKKGQRDYEASLSLFFTFQEPWPPSDLFPSHKSLDTQAFAQCPAAWLNIHVDGLHIRDCSKEQLDMQSWIKNFCWEGNEVQAISYSNQGDWDWGGGLWWGKWGVGFDCWYII